MNKKMLKFVLFSLHLIFFEEYIGFSSDLELPEGLDFKEDRFIYTSGKGKEDFSPEIQERIQLHEILRKLEAQAIGDDKALTSQEKPNSLPSYETFFETSEEPLGKALKNAQIGHFILETGAEIKKDSMISSHRMAALDYLTKADEALNPVLKDLTLVSSTIDRLFKGIASKTHLQRSKFSPGGIKFDIYPNAKNTQPPSLAEGCAYTVKGSKSKKNLRYECSYPIEDLIVFGINPNGKCAHYTALNKNYLETVNQFMQLKKEETRSQIICYMKEEIESIEEQIKKKGEDHSLLAKKEKFSELKESLLNKNLPEKHQKEVQAYLESFFKSRWGCNSDILAACLERDRVYVNWSISQGKLQHDYLGLKEICALFDNSMNPVLIHGFQRGSIHFTGLVEKGKWRQMILRKIHEREHQLFRKKGPYKEKDPQTGEERFVETSFQEEHEKYEYYLKMWVE